MTREPELEVDVFEASEGYVGRWNRLISTTNWEKGRIIHEWRTALQNSGAPATEFSDEAWSQLVGGVSGQHVGRLRRVYERFGGVYTDYEGLYWSHFQAALDWDDAEMWLEGSLQNSWSVAELRRNRWQTLGAVEGQEPQAEDLVVVEPDEDFRPTEERQSTADAAGRVLTDEDYLAEARSPAGPDFGDEEDGEARDRAGARESDRGPAKGDHELPSAIPLVRPFENLPELPSDLSEAFESFQLAILRHKSEDWQQVKRDDVLNSLEALKTLVLAPSAAEA
jgi:hypothetical protein